MEYNVKHEIGDLVLYPSKIYEEMRLLKIKGFKKEEREFSYIAESDNVFNDDLFYNEDEIINVKNLKVADFLSVYFGKQIKRSKEFLKTNGHKLPLHVLEEIEQEIDLLESKCQPGEFSN